MINTIFSIDIYEKALYRKIFIVKFVLNIGRVKLEVRHKPPN